jgi:hypothetical protein
VMSTAAVETGRVESVRWGLRAFWAKSKMTWGGILFIDLNLSATIHKREPLLIVLELISSSSGLKPLLMKL